MMMDGRILFVVGNDFSRPDDAWVQPNGGWQKVAPFTDTTENTMSIDVGDVDNNGQPEIFATDMKPVDKDLATMARGLPMMNRMSHPVTSFDPQRVENSLQVRDANGHWSNQGYQRFIDSSGWSWSSKLGDLDNDGFLDIYVVNGMIAAGLFSHLPNNELVEPNMAYRNDGRGSFASVPQWGLGSLASGRGMSMADLNSDGKLDAVTQGTFICRMPGLTTAVRLDVHFWWNITETLLLQMAGHFYLRQFVAQPAATSTERMPAAITA
jgi:hypothetical protein